MLGVGDGRAVIDGIDDGDAGAGQGIIVSVAVEVVVAGIAEGVVVSIGLQEVADVWAVVADVKAAVLIVIIITGIATIVFGLKTSANAEEQIGICLVGVGDGRAVVGGIENRDVSAGQGIIVSVAV